MKTKVIQVIVIAKPVTILSESEIFYPLKGITVKAKGGYTGEKSTTYGKNVVLKGMLE